MFWKLLGIQFLSNIFHASASCLPKAAMNTKDHMIKSRSMVDFVTRFIRQNDVMHKNKI